MRRKIPDFSVKRDGPPFATDDSNASAPAWRHGDRGGLESRCWNSSRGRAAADVSIAGFFKIRGRKWMFRPAVKRDDCRRRVLAEETAANTATVSRSHGRGATRLALRLGGPPAAAAADYRLGARALSLACSRLGAGGGGDRRPAGGLLPDAVRALRWPQRSPVWIWPRAARWRVGFDRP